MGEVADGFPDDLDVQTLHAEALMLLRPRRGSVDLEAPDVRAILPILEGVLRRDIRHPGACHLYIHLLEASSDPGRAEACADYLGDQIAISHIRHMPSHIYMNIGRYTDAVRSNQRAWHADQMAEHGGPPGVYPSHNLHMLLFAAVLDGQSAVAIQAAKDLSRVQPSWAWYVPVTLAIFGRWDEVLALTDEPADSFQAAMWHYARGMALLRTGDAPGAAREVARVEALRLEVGEDAQFRFHDQRDLLGIPYGILAAEIAHAAGRGEEAIEVLETALAIEDGLVYDEPEPWHLPVRHVLGAVLLDLGRPAEAEVVYRAALADHHDTGWSLLGLEQSLQAQGRIAEARETRAAYERSWSRADIWLRSSRF
jgi:tetratricopeptide (TPR) repeat protein